MGICETKSDEKFKLNIPGYKCYLNSRNNRGGGVAIVVKANIKHSEYKISRKGNIEFVGIKIQSNCTDLIVGQVYKPPKKKLLECDLNLLFNRHNTIIMGDLNCKRREWNCPTENPSGKVLLHYCLREKIIIAAPQNPTNFPTTGTPSVLDLFLLKCNYNYSVPVTKARMSSDHNPVEIKIAFNFLKAKLSAVYDYARANWSNFKSELNDGLMLNFHIKNKDEVESKANEFSELISRAIKNNIPLNWVNFQSAKLPQSLKLLIRYKNKIRKIIQRKPTTIAKILYKTLVKLVHNQLNLLESNAFEKFSKNLNFRDGSLWKFANKYNKKLESSSLLYDRNGSELNTDESRLNAFAEQFALMSNVYDGHGSRYFTNRVNSCVKNFKTQVINSSEINLTTVKEVVDTIKTLKSKKAAGHDNISARVLKSLPRKAIVFIVKLLNGMLLNSYFPNSWKISKVIPIHKKNKDVTQISSYRPISLLPHLSKIAEKIIKSRIVKFSSSQKILIDEQFGFRVGHSTTDQLARLVNEITSNFNKKLHTGALLLDIESAFPSVWHEGIIYKMIKYNFPGYLIKLICSYLENRSFFVSLNNEKSVLHKLLAGVPQGSVLGPLLFLIFINDAPKVKFVKESLFADDKLMFTASFRISAITKRLQQAFVANKRFFHKWKIKINDGKTEAILFTKRRPVINDNIDIGNCSLDWLKKVKYLGVVLDQKLNFSEHINLIVHNAIGKLIKLYPIFKNKHLTQNSKLIFYKTFIRTALLYACPVWSLACQTNVNKLQVVQNKFLRLIGNFRRFTPIYLMHERLNMEYVEKIIYKNSVSYYNKIANHSSYLVKNILYDKNVKYKHKHVI